MKRLIQILIIALLSIGTIGYAIDNKKPGCNQGPQDGGHGKPTPPSTGSPSPIPGDGTQTPVSMPMDPNEIIGLRGYDSLQWVKVSDQLAYTIYFENDPVFATAAAQKVEVRYAFDKKADMYSFGLGSFGFGSFIFPVEGTPTVYQKRLDVRDSLGIYVDVVAGLDIVKKEAFWILNSIDPETGLPPLEVHKGFLPVNDKTKHNGEGFVSFVMKPKQDCVSGDSITAEASIVFDTNEAISTNVWKNTIDAQAPSSKLVATPNPDDPTLSLFRFEAADDEKGSGLKQITVYLSQNKEAYKEYAVCTPDSVLSFTATSGAEYAFYSIAEDHTGNQEAQKEKADYTINSNTPPTDLALSDTIFSDDIALDGFIGELSTEDSEANQTFTYALAEGEGAIHNELFRITGSQLQAGALFKCAEDSVYQIRISTTDPGGLNFEKAFTLEMNKVLVKPLPDTLSVAICEDESFDFYDKTYNQTGIYTYQKENEYSCDSIYVLSLRVNPYPSKPTVTVEGTHTLLSSALSGNRWYNESGIIEEANERSFTPTETGVYYVTASNGNCESEASDQQYVNLSGRAELNWNLNKNWSWISINASEVTDAKILFEPVKASMDRIMGYSNELINDPTYGLTGGLKTMNAQQSYKLNMKEVAALELNGAACSPAETPIMLSKGWNWIGYAPIVELNPSTALTGLAAENGDVIKNLTDFAIYTDGQWIGSLINMKPGEGYMYSSASAKKLIYSSQLVSTVSQQSARVLAAPVTPWLLNESKYPNNMNVVAKLYHKSQLAESGIFTVGAFVGNECRGVGKLIDGYLFITIHGEEAGKTITFRAIENATGKEFEVIETLTFGEKVIGNIKQPYKLNVSGSITDIASNEFAFTIYPNPVREKLFIGGELPVVESIQILNTSGAIVFRTDSYSAENGIEVSLLEDGAYVIAITTEKGILYRKFIKSATK